MRPTRKTTALALGALSLAAVIAFSSTPVYSLSTGVGLGETGSGTARGCTCHSPVQNGAAHVTFTVDSLPNGYYEGGKTYTMHLSFVDDDVPMASDPAANHGGFSVVASAGAFKADTNSTVNVGGTPYTTVQTKDNGASVTHTKDGDVHGNRSFGFSWTAPESNASDISFDILVNAVNGDNANSNADRWTRTYSVLPGQPGAGGAAKVDISKLGVPLRAYWLGVIGILSTIFLLTLSFFVIRSGSKFYEFGLPRGQVKAVKVRTIPPPKGRGAYAVIAGLVVILMGIVWTFLSVRDEQLDAMKASMFVLGFAIVVALTFVYYIRAFLPIVDVLEEETVEPLR
jgi:hypothetical protein